MVLLFVVLVLFGVCVLKKKIVVGKCCVLVSLVFCGGTVDIAVAVVLIAWCSPHLEPRFQHGTNPSRGESAETY